MRVRKLVFFLSLGALACEGALAIPLAKCPTGNLDTESQARLIHKVALLGADGRESVEEFARKSKKDGFSPSQVQKDLSAFGILRCAGGTFTAQLTGSNDVITTARHAFFLNDCRPVVPLDRPCQFQPSGSKEKYEVHIDWNNLESSSDPRNVKLNCDHKKNRTKDWAVLKLKKPVPNASFFHVPSQPVAIEADQSVIQLSIRPNRDDRGFSSLAQKCQVREPYNFWGGTLAFHDCDTEPSASGGAQLVYDKLEKKYLLWAVHSGGKSNPTNPNLHRASTFTRPQSAKYEEYDGENNRNISVPVSQEMIDEINRLKNLGPSNSAHLGQ